MIDKNKAPTATKVQIKNKHCQNCTCKCPLHQDEYDLETGLRMLDDCQSDFGMLAERYEGGDND